MATKIGRVKILRHDSQLHKTVERRMTHKPTTGRRTAQIWQEHNYHTRIYGTAMWGLEGSREPFTTTKNVSKRVITFSNFQHRSFNSLSKRKRTVQVDLLTVDYAAMASAFIYIVTALIAIWPTTSVLPAAVVLAHVSRQYDAGHPSYDDVTGRQSICRRRTAYLEQPSSCHP